MRVLPILIWIFPLARYLYEGNRLGIEGHFMRVLPIIVLLWIFPLARYL